MNQVREELLRVRRARSAAGRNSPGRYWHAFGARQRRIPEPLWRRHSDAVNVAWLARYLPEAAQRVLKTDLFDEALSQGLYPFLSARALTVIGIDLMASTAGEARARHGDLPALCADVRRLPFADACFDAIVSNSTLDHFASLGEIEGCLAELFRVLRPGGQLLLTLDNLANPVVTLRNALPFAPLHALGVLPYPVGRTCGPRRLARMAAVAGFEVVETTAILHCPRVLAVAAAALLERSSPAAQNRFLAFLLRFEALARRRSRFRTGYFVAIAARRPRPEPPAALRR